MLRGEPLAEALKDALGQQIHLWPDLRTAAEAIASAYAPGVVHWVVHELHGPRDSSAGVIYAVQRGYGATETIFEDPVRHRAEMVRDALNRLEDMPTEGSNDQADGAS